VKFNNLDDDQSLNIKICIWQSFCGKKMKFGVKGSGIYCCIDIEIVFITQWVYLEPLMWKCGNRAVAESWVQLRFPCDAGYQMGHGESSYKRITVYGL
jgi:hypothetical protein